MEDVLVVKCRYVNEFELPGLPLEFTSFDLNYVKQVFIPHEKSMKGFEKKQDKLPD